MEIKRNFVNVASASAERCEAMAVVSKKLSYTSPKLLVYGSVSKLTMAKGGTKADGQSGMDML